MAFDGRQSQLIDRCVQYFDGTATFEEVSYRTGLHRKELERIMQLYKDDVGGCSLVTLMRRSS